jgi:predicted ribosomally synthesized peptide with SipW-like signal peptide
LAGALVLGVGATMTLAAWTDQEVATGAFAASVFDVVSSPDATPLTSHGTAPGATLTFAATGLSPGTSVFAHLDVATSTGSTVGGTLTLTAIGSATTAGIGLADALGYRIVRLTGTTTPCTASAFTAPAQWVTPATGAYTNVTAALPALSAVALDSGGVNVRRLCVEAQLAGAASSDHQGASSTVTWSFTGTSAG